MKNFVAGVILCLGLGGCSAPPPPGPSHSPSPGLSASASPRANAEWVLFKAPDGSFEVKLPGTPVVKEGNGLFSVSAALGQGRTFGVSRSDKKLANGGKQLTDEDVAQLLKEIEAEGVKVTKHDRGSFQGHAAIDVLGSLPHQQVADMVFIFTAQHTYQLVTTRPEGSEAFKPQDEAEFARSFKLRD